MSITWRTISGRPYREVGEEAGVLLHVAEGHAVAVAPRLPAVRHAARQRGAARGSDTPRQDVEQRRLAATRRRACQISSPPLHTRKQIFLATSQEILLATKGRRLTLETRVQDALDDVASNIWQPPPRRPQDTQQAPGPGAPARAPGHRAPGRPGRLAEIAKNILRNICQPSFLELNAARLSF